MKYYGIFMHIMRVRGFPAATHLLISPCLRASARSRGRIKQYFLFVAALVLPPAFLAVMIFHCNIRPLPAAGYHGFLYLYVRPFIAADTSLYLGIRCSSRTR